MLESETKAGIEVPEDCELEFLGHGSLKAVKGGGASIGGGYNSAPESITIQGGELMVVAGAAFGSGNRAAAVGVGAGGGTPAKLDAYHINDWPGKPELAYSYRCGTSDQPPFAEVGQNLKGKKVIREGNFAVNPYLQVQYLPYIPPHTLCTAPAS